VKHKEGPAWNLESNQKEKNRDHLQTSTLSGAWGAKDPLSCSCGAAAGYQHLLQWPPQDHQLLLQATLDLTSRHPELSPLRHLPPILQLHSVAYLHQWMSALRHRAHRWSSSFIPSPPILTPRGTLLIWNQLHPGRPLAPVQHPTYVPSQDSAVLHDGVRIHQPFYILAHLCPTCGMPLPADSIICNPPRQLPAQTPSPLSGQQFCTAPVSPPTAANASRSSIQLGTMLLEGALPLPKPGPRSCKPSIPPPDYPGLPQPDPATSPPPPEVTPLRLLSVNCGGLRHKLTDLLRLLRTTDPDIIALQEVGPLAHTIASTCRMNSLQPVRSGPCRICRPCSIPPPPAGLHKFPL
jgi:hypothetical protein